MYDFRDTRGTAGYARRAFEGSAQRCLEVAVLRKIQESLQRTLPHPDLPLIQAI